MICDLRFESQIAIAVKSRDLEHLVLHPCYRGVRPRLLGDFCFGVQKTFEPPPNRSLISGSPPSTWDCKRRAEELAKHLLEDLPGISPWTCGKQSCSFIWSLSERLHKTSQLRAMPIRFAAHMLIISCSVGKSSRLMGATACTCTRTGRHKQHKLPHSVSHPRLYHKEAIY